MMKARKPAQGAQASRIAVAGEIMIGGSKTDRTNGLRLGEQLVIFVESGFVEHILDG